MNRLTISDRSIVLYKLNEKLKVAEQNAFVVNQINELPKKIFEITIYKHKLLSEISNAYVP